MKAINKRKDFWKIARCSKMWVCSWNYYKSCYCSTQGLTNFKLAYHTVCGSLTNYVLCILIHILSFQQIFLEISDKVEVLNLEWKKNILDKIGPWRSTGILRKINFKTRCSWDCENTSGRNIVTYKFSMQGRFQTKHNTGQ